VIPPVIDDLVALVRSRPAIGATRLVTLDGHSGAGKTRLAGRLARASGRVPVVHLDVFYPGWDGLAAGVELAVDWVARPLVAGRRAPSQSSSSNGRSGKAASSSCSSGAVVATALLVTRKADVLVRGVAEARVAEVEHGLAPRSTSRTMARRTSSSSASIASSSDRPLATRTVARSKVRPMTAAVASTWLAVSLTLASRSRSRARTPRGASLAAPTWCWRTSGRVGSTNGTLASRR